MCWTRTFAENLFGMRSATTTGAERRGLMRLGLATRLTVLSARWIGLPRVGGACADRIILTEDAATFPAELAAHLHGGRTSPGVFVIRPSATVVAVLLWLESVAADDQPDQWRNLAIRIP